MATCAID